jgi:hypothetical protein
MRFGNNLCRLDGTPKVAGNDGINRLRSQTPSHLAGLLSAPLVQTALRLSLHHLARIVDGLAVTY